MPTPPSRGGVSSPFGMRVNPNDGIYRMHYGEDTLGAGNYAPVTGTVVFAGYDRTGTGLGWCVGIRQASDLSVIWWVAHHGESASVNPLLVAVGQHVTEAETYLGPKGESGAAQGVHCHTERRVDGAARPGSGIATNPRKYYTAAAGSETTPFEEPVRTAKGQTMSLYHKQGTTPTLYALAGDSPGTPANWLESTDQTLANQWSAQIGGPSAALSAGSWDNFKAQYLAPLKVAAPVSTPVTVVATKADVDAAAASVVKAIPSAEQNGAAARAAIVR